MSFDVVHAIQHSELLRTLQIPAVIAAIVYVLAPLLVRGSMLHTAKNTWRPVWIDDLPPVIHEAFNTATPALVACGFRALAHVRANRLSSLVDDTFAAVWINEATGDSAQVIAVRTKGATGVPTSKTQVTFRRDFPDGARVVTSNSTSARVFPRDPMTDGVTCRACRDLRRLYRFHAARADRAAAGRPGVLPDEERGVEDVYGEYLRDMNRVTRAGYFYLDPAADGFRPTLKGAFIMTWRTLFPFKQLSFAVRDRAADRELRALGFGGLHAFRNGTGPITPTPPAPPR